MQTTAAGGVPSKSNIEAKIRLPLKDEIEAGGKDNIKKL